MTPLYEGGLSVEEVRHKAMTDRIYKLSSNENPLGASAKVQAAIREAAANIHIYPPRKDDALRAALAGFHQAGLTASHFFTADSGCETLELICRGFMAAGDEGIISTPTFGYYARGMKNVGATIIDVPLTREFGIDVEGILGAVTERSRLVFVCNPNNPTGVLFGTSKMEQLLDGLPKHVIVVADEVYRHFVTDEDYPDTIQSILDDRNVILVQSFSKAFGMAGLRLGYAIAPPRLVQKAAAFRRPFHINAINTAAALAALEDTEHLQRSVAHAITEREWISAELTRLHIEHHPSQTNFVVFNPPMPAAGVEEELLKRGIMVRQAKGNGLPGWLRVSIGLREGNAAFIKALEEVLQ